MKDMEASSSGDTRTSGAYGKHERSGKKSTFLLWKNVLVLSAGFFLQNTSVLGLFSLQSSLHVTQGMGVITTSSRFAVNLISSLFLPKLMTSLMSHKAVILVSFSGYILWTVANGYGTWATMIPASIINGLCLTPTWVSQGVYCTVLGTAYSKIKRSLAMELHKSGTFRTNRIEKNTSKSESEEEQKSFIHQKEVTEEIELNNKCCDTFKRSYNVANCVAKYFALFYGFYNASGIVGNVMSSTILRQNPASNYSQSNKFISDHCGMYDCPWITLNNTNLDPPPKSIVWILCGVYIVFMLSGFLILLIFLDPLPSLSMDESNPDCNSNHVKLTGKTIVCNTINSLKSTLGLMRNQKILPLIPLAIYIGIEESFIWAEYNRSWVTCSIGIWHVGFTNIPMSVAGAVTSFVVTYIVEYTGRTPVVFAAICIDLTIQSVLVFWKINLNHTFVFYVITFLWGTLDAIWLFTCSSLYGITFPNHGDEAFSLSLFFNCIGYTLAFGYSNFLCTSTKVYILFSNLCVVILCYILLEVKLRQKKARVNESSLNELKQMKIHGENQN